MIEGEGLTEIACVLTLYEQDMGDQDWHVRFETSVPTVAGPWDEVEHVLDILRGPLLPWTSEPWFTKACTITVNGEVLFAVTMEEEG